MLESKMVVPVAKSNIAVVEFPASALEESLVAKATGGRVRFEVQTSTHRATGSWSSPVAAGWLDRDAERTIPLTLDENARVIRIVFTAVHRSANVELNLETD
jgi:hypothetical protein